MDSSALVKLLVLEEGSDEVRAFMLAHLDADAVLATSKLTGLELARFAVREGIAPALVERVMDTIDQVDITDEVLREAKAIPHHTKSLDAIHLGTASLADADLLITFDKNMAEVATKMGLRAGTPAATAE